MIVNTSIGSVELVVTGREIGDPLMVNFIQRPVLWCTFVRQGDTWEVQGEVPLELRKELTDLAAEWMDAHTQAFIDGERESWLGTFEFALEQIELALKESPKRYEIEPGMIKAERVGFASKAVQREVVKGLRTLTRAITALEDTHKHFAVALETAKSEGTHEL